jgi:hypothetical protein
VIHLPSRTDRSERALFVFRAKDCIDETGLFGRSYGKRVAGTFARSGRRSLFDQQSRLFVVPNGHPGIGFVSGEAALVVERSATQLVANPQTPSGFADVNTPVITTGHTGPFGATAILVSDDDAVATEGKQATAVFPADGTQSALVVVRKGSSPTMRVGVYDVTVPATRHEVLVTFGATADDAPTPTSNAGSGTIFPVVRLRDALGQIWWGIPFTAANVVAANNNRVRASVGSDGTGTGTFYLAGINAWNSGVPFSWQSSAATRAADAVSWSLPALTPRALSVYVRGREAGLYFHDAVNRRALHIGTSNPATVPYLGMGKGTAGLPFGQYQDGVTNVSAQTAFSGTAALGDAVEHRIAIRDDWTVISAASLNGGAETVAAPSAAASADPAAFAAASFHLTGALTSNAGAFSYTHIVIAEGVRTMDELRELAGI